jgi:hypothetical protein
VTRDLGDGLGRIEPDRPYGRGNASSVSQGGLDSPRRAVLCSWAGGASFPGGVHVPLGLTMTATYLMPTLTSTTFGGLADATASHNLRWVVVGTCVLLSAGAPRVLLCREPRRA